MHIKLVTFRQKTNKDIKNTCVGLISHVGLLMGTFNVSRRFVCILF